VRSESYTKKTEILFLTKLFGEIKKKHLKILIDFCKLQKSINFLSYLILYLRHQKNVLWWDLSHIQKNRKFIFDDFMGYVLL